MSEKHYPTDVAGELDAGSARDHREAPRCCARVTIGGRSGWCRLRDGHVGDHSSRLSDVAPPGAFDKGRKT